MFQQAVLVGILQSSINIIVTDTTKAKNKYMMPKRLCGGSGGQRRGGGWDKETSNGKDNKDAMDKIKRSGCCPWCYFTVVLRALLAPSITYG